MIAQSTAQSEILTTVDALRTCGSTTAEADRRDVRLTSPLHEEPQAHSRQAHNADDDENPGTETGEEGISASIIDLFLSRPRLIWQRRPGLR